MIRYTSPPTKFDSAEYGTICTVMKNDEGTEQELFIQVSTVATDPHWIPVTELMLTVFKRHLADSTFIQGCLMKYSLKN